MNVLITGGAGYFGTAFVRRLLQDNSTHRVCVYSRDEHKHEALHQAVNDGRLRTFVGDVRDEDRLAHAMRGIDHVIHAAALKRVQTGEYDTIEMTKTNVEGTCNVVRACLRTPLLQSAVLLSSDKAYAPANAYGASKFLAEKIFQGANAWHGSTGPVFKNVRYGNVAGSTGSVIPLWREKLRTGAQITVTDMEATRFWMTRKQAVDLVYRAMLAPMPGDTFIPDLPAFRVGDLLPALINEADLVAPPHIRVTGLCQGEKRHESMDEGRCSETARRMSIDELMEALRNV